MLPTNIDTNTFDTETFTSATLYTPEQGFNYYYSNPQWGRFITWESFNEPYLYFYLADDFLLNDVNGRVNGEPDADVNPGGGLIVEGDEDQNLDDLHVIGDDDNGGSVIGDGNINPNHLYIDYNVKKNKWYFFCFPY